MRKIFWIGALLAACVAQGRERPDFVGDLLYPPPPRDPALDLPVYPLTVKGAQDVTHWIRQACVDGNGVSYCEKASDQRDHYYVYRLTRSGEKEKIAEISRNTSEHIAQVDAENRRNADGSYPEDRYLAKLDAYRSNLEYGEYVCAGASSICGAMAGKLHKWIEIFTAGCATWGSSCAKAFKDEREKIKNEIDRIKAACAKGDQQCVDAVTGGAEKLTRAEEVTAAPMPTFGGYAHGGWAPGKPVYLPGGIWYDGSCRYCKIIEGKEAEDYEPPVKEDI